MTVFAIPGRKRPTLASHRVFAISGSVFETLGARRTRIKFKFSTILATNLFSPGRVGFEMRKKPRIWEGVRQRRKEPGRAHLLDGERGIR